MGGSEAVTTGEESVGATIGCAEGGVAGDRVGEVTDGITDCTEGEAAGWLTGTAEVDGDAVGVRVMVLFCGLPAPLPPHVQSILMVDKKSSWA